MYFFYNSEKDTKKAKFGAKGALGFKYRLLVGGKMSFNLTLSYYVGVMPPQCFW